VRGTITDLKFVSEKLRNHFGTQIVPSEDKDLLDQSRIEEQQFLLLFARAAPVSPLVMTKIWRTPGLHRGIEYPLKWRRDRRQACETCGFRYGTLSGKRLTWFDPNRTTLKKQSSGRERMNKAKQSRACSTHGRR
jgi:hypothetical protein